MLQKALFLAGDQHKYQKRTLILLSAIWLCYMIASMSSPYLFMDPIFNCENSTLSTNQMEDTCEVSSSCSLQNNFVMTSQNGLYCQNKWERITIQSSYAIGAFLGMFFVNILSDVKGRKKALILSLSMLLLGTFNLICGGFYNSSNIIIIGQFLRGLGGQPVWVLGMVFVAQFFGDQIRPTSLIMMQSIGGLSFLIMGFSFSLKLNWFIFITFVQVIPIIITLCMTCLYLHESPHYLMNQNQVKNAEKVLSEIAAYNDRVEYIEEIQELLRSSERESFKTVEFIKITDQKGQVQSKQQNQHSLKQVLKVMKQWNNMKNIALISAIVIVAQMNYFGINYSFSETGMGYTINNYITFIAQTGSIFVSNPIISRVSRKKGLIFSWGMVAVLGFLYLMPSVKNNLLISTIFIGVIRVFAACGNTFTGCIATEVFNSKIQSTAFGIIQTIGIAGVLAAPFVIEISHYFGIHPFSGFSIATCLVLWTPFFLKSQNKKSLTQISLSSLPQRKSLMLNCPAMMIQETKSSYQKDSLEIQLIQISTKTSL